MKMKTTLFFTTLIFFVIIFKSQAQVDNTFGGEGTGINNTGDFNTGYGKNSLINNTSNSNSAFGAYALYLPTGGFNCAFGNEALRYNGFGSLNCAIGTRSLINNDSGNRNVAFGHRALEANINGSNNTAIGYAALLQNVGSNNIAIGSYTPRSLLTGDSNIFIGTETGSGLLNGSNNVFIGKVTLSNDPSNTLIAGNDTNKTIILADGEGRQKLFIHRNGNVGIGLGNNVIPVNRLDIKGGVVIGKNYTPRSNPTTFAGEVAPTNGLLVEGKVGIGTNSPDNKVEIKHGTNGNSGLRFTNLTSNFDPSSTNTSNKFLSVNASGDVILQNLPSLSLINNSLVSANNLMTSTVNGDVASANIINSISNSITTNNQLITTVNGVASTPVNLPVSTFTEIDGSITNELQTLSQIGNTITLSNGGGSFTLPTYTDTDAQSLSLTGNNLSISNGNTVVLPTFNDTDAQSLTLTGNSLSISNGNSVVLPTYTDVPQTITQTGNVVTLSNGGGSFNLPTYTDTDAQSLTLVGNNLSISNGNSVVLPTYTDVPQTISQTGNVVTLSNGGGSFNLPTFTDSSLYAADGIINQATTTSNNRIVDMNNSNIWFNTANSTSNGKIYLGASSVYPSTTGNYKLFVEGGILTEKVKVAVRNTFNWADYVFAKDYKLMPLKEVEQFVTINKHLPGISSASELVKNGLDVAEMQSKQMEKIEELTLYIIDQNKSLELQNKAIEKNNKEIEDLKNQLKALIEKTK